MPSPDLHPGRGWYTKSESAAVLDITSRNFDRSYLRYAPPPALKMVGNRQYIHLRSLLDAWRAAGQPVVSADGGDPLLTSAQQPDSPELERYRAARADLAEMERDRQRLHLIPREVLDPALAMFVGVLRRAGEALVRRFGNEAAAILNEALDEFEASIRTMLGVEAEKVDA